MVYWCLRSSTQDRVDQNLPEPFFFTAMPSYRSLMIVLAVGMPLGLVGCTPNAPTTGPTVMDADAPTEYSETESGIKYRILRKGNGRRPTAASRVTVDYTGKLDNGRVFDDSYVRAEPTKFALANVVAGWTEGMQLVSEGGMIELIIPSELGYGEKGNSGIPPNSTLNFKVELHSFE